MEKQFSSKKVAQSSTEYLVIVGFVTFALMSILVLAYTYTDIIRDQIRLNQMESFVDKIINSAKSVFYSGEPSKISITIYIPSGVQNIDIMTNSVLVNITTASGNVIRVFPSGVPLSGSISLNEGTKKVILTAQADRVVIS